MTREDEFKFWCEKCGKVLTEHCDRKFGEGNWTFSNLKSFFNFDTKRYIDGLTPLYVAYHPKTKKGEISKKSRQTFFNFNFCPFCGERWYVNGRQ